ncbi:rac GTPase-activating protein 1 [Contarinia nasturtii]|uniref:rac GTPase-activating protein 1 n=1 Tax=Contarinia nasturtii TaxID=265458 RepID=UPI0012D3ED37|nr:rac GTPase-activating protein 1 [Contarinia nasturtii]
MELSLVASFDELRRCQDILTDGTAEIEFRRFLQIMEESRLQWQATTAEAQRLQRELDKCLRERSDFETKLFHARRLLETESKARKAAELERDHLEKKLSRACEYLHTDREINDETRNKLAFLNMSSRKRKSKSNRFVDENYGNEINSTGSFLSDLSVTKSEEDFLEMSKPFKKHRPSVNAPTTPYAESKHARRSARRSMDLRNKKNASIVEVSGSDKIVATTKVSIPQGDGPIQATSTIETPSLYPKIDTTEQQYSKCKKKAPDTPLFTPTRNSMKLQEDYPMPSAPPLQEVTNNPKLLLNLQGRQHEFSSRMVLRSENCAYCLKKFSFGTSALKCRLCSVYLHQDCKIQFAMACVPKSQGTPGFKNGKQGYISEYVPLNEGPMLPPLVVYCINEVETRGLSEEGIYRVSGSEKEVKALKERFLRGKTPPILSGIDIHVICGCIKDFLRSLREPLIPTSLWKNFSNAVQTVDEATAVRELFAAINQLPQANRDTLAFLVMHLQRVASCKAIKMPTENLAKIFGPTVVGYSSADPDQHAIFTETMIQKDVMLHLLEIPTDYWNRFILVDTTDDESQKVSGYSFFGTPNARPLNATMLRKERKFFATPPYNTTRRH